MSLQSEIAEYRKEMAQISQVDEFAKYSKIQRKLRSTTDKLSAISREDLELSLKSIIMIKVTVWSLVVLIAMKLIYDFMGLLIGYLQFSLLE